MDPFSTNQGFSMLNIFKKSKSQASVENTIAVIGVKMALLVGELSQLLGTWDKKIGLHTVDQLPEYVLTMAS